MSEPALFDPRSLPRRARAALDSRRAAFAHAAGADGTSPPLSVRIGDGDAFDLPPALARLVAAALAEAAAGHAVELRALSDELTTQQAADLMGVSRPFVVKLVDAGDLPARMVGTHRRLRLDHVLAYRERMRQVTDDALQALTDQAQELGMGYGAGPDSGAEPGPGTESNQKASA